MAAIRLKHGDILAFQLLRKNLAGISESARIWQEIKVVILAVQPSYVDYNYRGRSQIHQTQERSGFVDKYGMLFTQVNMGGSFGVQPRRVGLSLKDGYTRLIEFRDEIVKKSNRVNDELDRQEGQTNIFGNTVDVNAKYVYALNFYDFINSEMFAIDISTFNIRLDAGYNTVLPTYKLGFQEIGDIIKVETKDGVLRAQLDTALVIDFVQNVMDSASDLISNNSIFRTAEFGLTLGEEVIGQVSNLKGVLSMYHSAITGKSILNSSISSPSGFQFSSVKG